MYFYFLTGSSKILNKITVTAILHYPVLEFQLFIHKIWFKISFLKTINERLETHHLLLSAPRAIPYPPGLSGLSHKQVARLHWPKIWQLCNDSHHDLGVRHSNPCAFLTWESVFKFASALLKVDFDIVSCNDNVDDLLKGVRTCSIQRWPWSGGQVR